MFAFCDFPVKQASTLSSLCDFKSSDHFDYAPLFNGILHETKDFIFNNKRQSDFIEHETLEGVF